MLREDQQARYARHLSLGEVGVRGQARLLASRVHLVGVGRAAEEAAVYLAAAGVGELTLDPALIARVGPRLHALNPDVAVRGADAPAAPRDLLARPLRCAPAPADSRLAGALAAQAALVALTGAGPPFTWRVDAPEPTSWHA